MSVRRIWLVFAQWVTIAVAVLFVLQTLRPEWLPGGATPAPAVKEVVVRESPVPRVAAEGRAASYADAVQHALPAVVNIFTSKAVKSARQHPFAEDPVFRRFFGDMFGGDEAAQRAASLGSGVVVSPRGYILTNNHVVEAANGIEIAFSDGRTRVATVVGTDPETDLAVLKVDGDNLPAITFAPSDAAKVGDVVLAIGNPFGVGQTVTMGIVSALGRSQLGINTFENFIQTDAAINPGNSGGALVDATGSLVGINTAIYSRTGGSLGIGFAIPGSIARQVMEQLIQNGTVIRGWIGVEAQEVTAELADSFKLSTRTGTLIANVLRGGPADRGGVRPGDVLLAVDGQEVTDPTRMLNIVAGLKPESTVPLKVRREGKDLELPVVVGKRPAPRKIR
jgi:Do/DeqQ family serine protease